MTARQFGDHVLYIRGHIDLSQVYLVWSRRRSDLLPDGQFNLWEDTRTLYRLYPKDVFLVKFSYRFPL